MQVVAQDEEVVSVPLAVSISLHAALLGGEMGGEVGVLLEAGLLDEFSALAAFILHEAANATSFYRTYSMVATRSLLVADDVVCLGGMSDVVCLAMT